MTAPVHHTIPVIARWLPGRPRIPAPAFPEEESPWMSQEDLAPAWAVSALTLAALATLLGLALLG